jgi:hypothetical protein
VVRLGDVLQRDAVRDHLARLEAAGLDVLDQARQVALDAGLVHAQRQALVHRVADRHRVEGRPVHADDGHVPPLRTELIAQCSASRRRPAA